jgi:VanZ family protein
MALLLLVPVPHRLDALATRYDGLAHVLIFLAFSLLYQLDRGPAPVRTLAFTVLLAGGTELVQWALPYRGGQWSDFVMGVIGAGIGVILSLLAARWPRGEQDEAMHPDPASGDAR